MDFFFPATWRLTDCIFFCHSRGYYAYSFTWSEKRGGHIFWIPASMFYVVHA